MYSEIIRAKAIDELLEVDKSNCIYIDYTNMKYKTMDGEVKNIELPDDKIEAKIKELEAEEVKKSIEQRATNFVKKQLKELDYDNEGEVALYASNPNSEWHDEAVALQKWVEDVYKKMYELIDSVTVDNYKDIDLDKIEAEYPAFKA